MIKVLKAIVVFTIVIVMSVNCFIVPVRSEAVAGGAVVGALAGGGSAVLLAVLGTAIVLAGGSIISEAMCSDPTTQAYNYNSMYKNADGVWVNSMTTNCMANQILSKYYEMTPEQQQVLDGLASKFLGVKPTEINGQIMLNENLINTLALGTGAILELRYVADSGTSYFKTYYGTYGINDVTKTYLGTLYGCFKIITAKTTVNGTTTYTTSNFTTPFIQHAYTSQGAWSFIGDWTNTEGLATGESAIPWGGTNLLNVAGVDVPVTRTPSGVRANVGDLVDSLQYPAIALNPAQALPYELSVPNVDVGELNNLKISAGITSVFPFCLPFDFVRGLAMLSQKPVAPVFTIPFNIPSFGAFEGSENNVVLDMSKYDNAFYIVRWIEVALFAFLLIFISFKIVKGVR